MFNEVFDFTWWIVQLSGYYIAWDWISDRLSPAFSKSEISSSTNDRPTVTRIMTFLHALFCSSILILYMCNIINVHGLFMARAVSTSFLAHELRQTWAMENQVQNQNAKNLKSPVNPKMQSFHHIITWCILYGWLGMSIPDKATYGILIYYIGEIPIVFLQMTWFYLHMGEEHRRECAAAGILTVQSYFLCRVLSFGAVLLFWFLPTCSLFNPFSWISLAMASAAYALNVLWFLDLIRKNIEFLPEDMAKTPIWATLIQYSMQLP